MTYEFKNKNSRPPLHTFNSSMDAFIEGYLNQGKIMGVAIYKGEQHIASRLWAVDRSSADYLQVNPPSVLPIIDQPQGATYLQQNGVNLNKYRMRYVKSDNDESLQCNIVILAGKNDPKVPDQPAGAFVYVTPNKSQIVVAYGPGQSNGPAGIEATKIVEALIGSGY